MTSINNISHDFFDTINNYVSNPIVLVVFVFIILIYYILFAFLGGSSNNESSQGSSFVVFEGLLWGLFILLIFINGIYYFYNVNILTYFNDIFSNEPEIIIEKTKDKPTKKIVLDKKEVFHVPGARFTYHDAKAVCKAFDSELATYEELQNSQINGSNWCSYGWTQDQLGLYPTSQNHFKKLQKDKEHKYDCGLPGINGGYVSNPYVKLGANCYGVKPKKSRLESEYLDNQDLYPKTRKQLLFDERVKFWKNRIGNILINPFNNDNWFKNEQKQAVYIKEIDDAKLQANEAIRLKEDKKNELKFAKQDSKIANISADVAKSKANILNTDTEIIVN